MHSAAGGVGLAALNLAKHTGCRLLASCGRNKHDKLRAMFPDDLVVSEADMEDGVTEKLFDSHDPVAFASGVEAAGGADVVINSLAKNSMLRSLQGIRPFGRFVEVGKRDQFEGTDIPAMNFAQGGQYMSAHLDLLMQVAPQKVAKIMRAIWTLLLDGVNVNTGESARVKSAGVPFIPKKVFYLDE